MKKRTKENKSLFLNKKEKVLDVKENVEIKTENINTENSEIEKIKTELTKVMFYQRKQKHNLFGEFEDDEYSINNKEILDKLIKVPKKFENQDGQTLYLSTKLDIFVLNFKIDIDISYSFCNAKLSIIEIENGAAEDIKHTTELERVVEDYAPGFREKIFAKWGVYFDDEQISKDDYLLRYLKMQHEEFLFNKELIAILSQLYILRMLKLFDNLGEIGEKLKQDYQVLMEEKIQQNPSLSIDFTFQKELLDYIIKKNNALTEILKTSDGRAIMNAYLEPLGNIKDKKFDNITESIRKEEKKEEKKVSDDSIIKWGSTLSKTVTKPCPKIDLSKLFGKSDKLAEPPSFVFSPIEIVTTIERPREVEERRRPETPINNLNDNQMPNKFFNNKNAAEKMDLDQNNFNNDFFKFYVDMQNSNNKIKEEDSSLSNSNTINKV